MKGEWCSAHCGGECVRVRRCEVRTAKCADGEWKARNARVLHSEGDARRNAPKQEGERDQGREKTQKRSPRTDMIIEG